MKTRLPSLLLSCLLIAGSLPCHGNPPHVANLTLVSGQPGFNAINVTFTPKWALNPGPSTQPTTVSGTLQVGLHVSAMGTSDVIFLTGAGTVSNTDMRFQRSGFLKVGYDISLKNMSGNMNSGGVVRAMAPATGDFTAADHRYAVTSGSAVGSVGGGVATVNEQFTESDPLLISGSGTGNLALALLSESGGQRTYAVTVTVPVDGIWEDNADYQISGSGTLKATGTLVVSPFIWAGTSADMNTSANWNPASVPSATAGDSMLFNGSSSVNNISFPGGTFSGSDGLGGLTMASTQTAALTINNSGTAGSVFRLRANANLAIQTGAGAFSFGNGGNAFFLNPASSGTNTFTNNSFNLATIGDRVQINASGGAQAGGSQVVFDGSGNWRVNGTTTNAVTRGLIKNGSGTLTLAGDNAHTATTMVNAGTLALAHVNAVKSSTLNTGGVGPQQVTFTITGTATFNTGNNVLNGVIATGNSTINHTGSGSLKFQRFEVRGEGNRMTGGHVESGVAGTRRCLLVGNTSAGTFTISGGTFTSFGGASQPDVIGTNTGGLGTLSISGGIYVNPGTLSFGTDGTSHKGGVLNINFGSATIGTLAYNTDADSSGNQGIVNLNGGTLALGAIANTRGTTRQFNFNGGQFVASGSVNFDSSLTLNVQNGGAKIDTSGHSVTVSGNLVENGSGGLSKAGAGTLTLAGTNTYTGATTVSAGDLTVGPTGSIDVGEATTTGTLAINGGGTMLVDGGRVTLRGGGSTSNGITLGDNASAGNITVRNNGSLTLSDGRCVFGNGATSGSNSAFTSVFAQTGGTTNISGGTSYAGNFRPATIDISGGTFTALDTFGIGVRANTTLTVSGTAEVALGELAFGWTSVSAAADTSVTVNLNAGTLAVSSVTVRSATNRTHTFNFDGGTLRATGASTSFFSTGPDLTASVKAGGGTLDNNGFDITIGQDLLTDAVSTGGGLTFAGSGTTTLGGSNTYTGATIIRGGALLITGATHATTAIIFESGGVLGLDTGGSVSATSAAVHLADGAIRVSGTTGAPSYTLLTAASISGTPVLADPVPGYELQVVGGNELRLVETAASTPYETWAGPGVPFDGDTNGDGISNGLAFLLGASGPNVSALDKLPTPAANAGGLVLTFQTLATAARGTALLKLEYSNSLAPGSWTAVTVPGSAGVFTDGGVTFTITGGGPLDVTATIPTDKAAGDSLFGRLKAESP